jgi:ABC-2 type transport system permease protein
MNFPVMNYRAIAAIFRHQISSTFRFPVQSIVSPVLSTVLYFIVFGAGIGARISAVNGISYGAFIVPGLIMQAALLQSISSATSAIYFPRFTGTIYEILSAPLSFVEIVAGYAGAAATKAFVIGLIILATACLFVPIEIQHPFWMLSFLFMTCVTFSLLGFIIGIWADSFEQLQLVPVLAVMPLTFLGGSFYSIKMLPPLWQEISLVNPVVYLISGFRWSFYGNADVGIGTSLAVVLAFLTICLAVTAWIFKTGYRLRN